MEFKIYVYFQTPFSGIFRHFLKNLFCKTLIKCKDLVYPYLKVYVLLHELWLKMYMFKKLFMVIELLIEVVVVKNYMDPLLKHSS